MATVDEIISKIHKLRSLEQNGATEGEVQAAATAIQRLMLAHGIKEAHLSIAQGKPLTGYGYVSLEAGSEQWRIDLLTGIAQGNGCRLIRAKSQNAKSSRGEIRRGSKHVRKYDIFGHRDSVKLVLALYAELSEVIQWMSEREYAKAYTDTHKRTWRNSWHLGAAQKIVNRFQQQLRMARVEGVSNSTALIVIENRTDEVVAKVYRNLRTIPRSKTTLDTEAYYSGAKAAENMNLSHTERIS